MPSLKHIHTYIRRTGSPRKPLEGTMKCADPSCTHFDTAFNVKDKLSLCSKCGTGELILTYKNLSRARPLCEMCSNTKVAREKRELKSKLEEMGIV